MNIVISDRPKYRTMFLSDIHLGSRNCKAERLTSFLKSHDAETLYLIGDTFDGDKIEWPPGQYDVARLLLQFEKVIAIVGNHDSWLRPGTYDHLEVVRTARHSCVDGRTLLVSHGDETDMVSFATLEKLVTLVERNTGFHLWEILRRNIGWWIRWHTRQYEKKMVARIPAECDGVICGHIHFPKIRGPYMNTGDWTHHCTAIVENYDGTFELIQEGKDK